MSIHGSKLAVATSDDRVLAEAGVADLRTIVPKILRGGTAVKLDLRPPGHWVVSSLRYGGLADDARSNTRHMFRTFSADFCDSQRACTPGEVG